MSAYFVHIPKTAGTSLRNAFRNYVTPVYGEAPPRKRMLMWGHFPYGLHAHYGDLNPAYFTVLRDPRDRVVSNYFHFKRSAPIAPHVMAMPIGSAIHTGELSLEAYIAGEGPPDQGMPLAPDSDSRNLMTRFVCGFDEEPSVDLALDRLESFVAVGVHGRLPQLVEAIARHLGTVPPILSHDNAGAYGDVDSGIRRLVERYNALDCELWELVQEVAA